MEPVYVDGNVRAPCTGCDGAISTFEITSATTGEYGHIIVARAHFYKSTPFHRIVYRLLRCAGCGRGGLATIHDHGDIAKGTLESFYPTSINYAKLPDGIPQGILAEYREAELCASIGAWRAASALLRSSLEKTLRANGYTDGSLKSRIDDAASDGIITAARQRRAHDEVRVLVNDILHEDWRLISAEEYESAHHYVQRILEDFYDLRTEVEDALRKVERLVPAPADEGQA